jgi:hypothetical protein
MNYSQSQNNFMQAVREVGKVPVLSKLSSY